MRPLSRGEPVRVGVLMYYTKIAIYCQKKKKKKNNDVGKNVMYHV
jgi:hypothetical protein